MAGRGRRIAVIAQVHRQEDRLARIHLSVRVAIGTVGRVVEGMDILELIVTFAFAPDAETQRERGRPRDNIRIEKIERL